MDGNREVTENSTKHAIHAALFRDRHFFPDYVTDAVFDNKFARNPLDIISLTQDAMNKLEGWKKQGITGVYIYLTGLSSATIAVMNAAYTLDMYVRVMHYSYLTDSWLPQTLDWCCGVAGYNNVISPKEAELIAREVNLQLQMRPVEYRTFVKYMKAFQEGRLRRLQGESWESIKESFIGHMRLEQAIVDIMPKYFNKRGGESDDGDEDKFHIKLRKRIIESRLADTGEGEDPWDAIDDRVFRNLRPEPPHVLRHRYGDPASRFRRRGPGTVRFVD